MNAAQIHLALNHAPLFLSIAGGLILIFGMIRNNQSIKILSLYFLLAAAVFAIPVFLTGEGTEEIVERMAGVNKTAIEAHEERAGIALTIVIITGVIALAALIFSKRPALARVLFSAALLLSLLSFGAMASTAHLGGLVRHAELKSGVQAEQGGDKKPDPSKDASLREGEAEDDD